MFLKALKLKTLYKNEYTINKLYLLQEYKLVQYLKTYYINHDLKRIEGKKYN